MQKSVKAFETGKADEEGVKGKKRTKQKTNVFQDVNLRAHLSREFLHLLLKNLRLPMQLINICKSKNFYSSSVIYFPLL